MYRLILLTLLQLPSMLYASSPGEDHGAPALTYSLTTMAVLREKPDGRIVDIWNHGMLFTSNVAEGGWVRVTGYFPNDLWQPVDSELWINTHYIKPTYTDKDHPPPSNRPNGIVRYVEVNKSTFELKVIEEKQQRKKVIFKTRVALGMDRCLPEEKGGNCYYTEPGTYHVRWKVHDPDGIEWCIPKSMEKEYPRSIAQGKRCFRGVLGSYALNIGKTYAIHGTNRPASLGKRVSHGCVRTANRAVKLLYDLLDIGDRVVIRE
jgi:hypothetical protein